MAVSGCGKKTPTAAAPPQPAPQAQDQTALAASQPVTPQPGQPPNALVQPDGQQDLRGLDRALLRWLMGHHRPPANFEDFAASAGVAIPPPPPGKKYFIRKDMHIELVNR